MSTQNAFEIPVPVKAFILSELRKAEGGWVTGEALGRACGMSRAAISKRMRALRARGYVIESVTRKGHRLVEEPDDLEREALESRLGGGRFARGQYVHVAETGSTNDDARMLAQSGAPEGSLVVADVQTEGRGRRGRVWHSAPGESLLVSLVLRPPIAPMRCGWIPLLTAVALRGALLELGISGVGIKWPNDVLVDGRKLAGILCEISSDFEQVSHAVVGIGLNVNTAPEAFPAEVRALACSLRGMTGQVWRRADVLVALLAEMDHWLDRLWAGELEALKAAWEAGSVTLGRQIEVQMPNGELRTGLAECLDEGGGLWLRLSGGQRQLLTSGEVSLGTRPLSSR